MSSNSLDPDPQGPIGFAHVISLLRQGDASRKSLTSIDEEESSPHSYPSVDQSDSVPKEFLDTDQTTGLSDDMVLSRSHRFGPNELSENVENLFKKFVSYFIGPIQFVMELAILLAAGLQLWIDFGIICAMLLLNAAVGFIQEYQAGSIVSQLKTSMALRATALRNGQSAHVNASELVPGDIVLLSEGSIIPADGHLLEDEGPGFILVDQSTITGESLPLEKRHLGELFSSSTVRSGRGKMIVTAIGDDTFIGKTAALVNKTERAGHFAAVLAEIGTILLVLVVIFITIVLIVGFYRSESMVTILTSIFIITLVGVPVGLPAVVTTTLAVGASDLARKKAVVRKLSSIESLAGVNILCSDKTGTLTENKLTVHEPIPLACEIEDLLFVACCTCSRSIKGIDAIDKALLIHTSNYPAVVDRLSSCEVISFQPFDPVSKRACSTIVEDPNFKTICLKGSPKAVLDFIKLNQTNLESSDENTYVEHVENLASRGFRTLGVAKKSFVADHDDNEQDQSGCWELLGLIPMLDPPRKDAAATIKEAKRLGLSVKMLTGDAIGIAKETCRQLGLGTNIYSASIFSEDIESQSRIEDSTAFRAKIEEADGFAEVYPQHKYQVVEELQKAGYLVAMTGDGVNDAPSLKIADAGIAVEGASTAARTAADIIFLKAGVGAIIDALKTSRMIFQRMRSYVIYRIALSLHLEIYFSTSLAILGQTINVALVAFLAIFSDIATLAIAYDKTSFSLTPSFWHLGHIWIFSSVLGLFLAGTTWVLTSTLLIPGKGIIQSQGIRDQVIFLQIALSQSWVIFISRYSIRFEKMELPSIQLVLAILMVDIIATLFCLFGWFTGGNQTDIVTVISVWLYSFGSTIILFLVFFIMNHVMYRHKERKTSSNIVK